MYMNGIPFKLPQIDINDQLPTRHMQIILNDTHRYVKLDSLLKALFSIADMPLYSNRL